MLEHLTKYHITQTDKVLKLGYIISDKKNKVHLIQKADIIK